MDINSILPLLLSGGKAETSDIIKALMGDNANFGAIFDAVSAKQKNKAEGLKPVLDFVSNDILGVMTRFFA